ncbi:MAG TPA: hypothetical protein VFR02_09405 [bacterium]|nr:hypothetical protein [bacterium]
MRKFWTVAFSLAWLGAQAAWADLADRGGHYGNKHDREVGDGGNGVHDNGARDGGGWNAGARDKGARPEAEGGPSRPIRYREENSRVERQAVHPRAATPAWRSRATHVNQARPEAYEPRHFYRVESAKVPVPNRFKHLGVGSLPRPLTDRSHYVTSNRAHSNIPLPALGPQGGRLSAHLVARTQIGSPLVRQHMAAFSSNVELDRINHYNRVETIPNHYYWHTYGGYSYCHYYDPWGYHWYGWYVGDSCFWARYYWGNWWWYDPVWARWCYWHDGGWWWNDPSNTTVVYVYENGAYQPADVAPDTTAAPPTAPSGNTSPQSAAPIPEKESFPSPDGSRVVKIFGDSRDAVLSDQATPPKLESVFLGSNVKSVRFAATTDGGTQILVTYGDGTVKNFDEDGHSLDDAPPNGDN